MAALEDAGREALTEMRRILGVLRRIDDSAVLVPQPGVGQIPALVESACEGGRQVALRVDGDPGPLPASVDISAYRILHEALTIANLGPVEIALRFGDDDLVLDVVADGPTAAQWPTPAMWERAALCDATLDVTTSPSSADADACADAADIRRRAGMSITIVIADDQELIRTGFRMILDSEDDLEVVGEAATGREAVALARRLRPASC